MVKVYYDEGYVIMAKEEIDEFLNWATENDIPYKIEDAETGALIDARA